MITLHTKYDCCGCAGCVQVCPVSCIEMKPDEEGFLYQETDVDICINCHQCEKVCPVINQYEQRTPLQTLAASNKSDAIKSVSSSGGIFDALARRTIAMGGVVFGVKLNEKLEAVHAAAETMEEVQAFHGSKYVQSAIGTTYKQAQALLRKGREVLFAGTPCQIAGLNHFLRRKYKNLMTMEVVCHGVPSPGIWQHYINNKLTKEKQLRPEIPANDGSLKAAFRDKRKGWEFYGLTLFKSSKLDNSPSEDREECFYEDVATNPYLRGFISDLYLRPSCHQCPARHLTSHADITLGDFWHLKKFQPEFYEPKGTSMVLLNTERAEQVFAELENISSHTSEYKYALIANPALTHNPEDETKRVKFFEQFRANPERFAEIVEELSKRSFLTKVVGRLKRMIRWYRLERL